MPISSPVTRNISSTLYNNIAQKKKTFASQTKQLVDYKRMGLVPNLQTLKTLITTAKT